MQRPNDVPAQTPTPPIINGTGTQMPEGGFPIPDIFARRNPLSLPGSAGFEAQAFSSSIKPAGYREGGDVKGMNISPKDLEALRRIMMMRQQGN